MGVISDTLPSPGGPGLPSAGPQSVAGLSPHWERRPLLADGGLASPCVLAQGCPLDPRHTVPGLVAVVRPRKGRALETTCPCPHPLVSVPAGSPPGPARSQGRAWAPQPSAHRPQAADQTRCPEASVSAPKCCHHRHQARAVMTSQPFRGGYLGPRIRWGPRLVSG